MAKRDVPEISGGAMADIAFMLLIFFLVTTTFSTETGVDVHKPKANTARALSRESILVAVTKEGSIHINNHKVDLEILNSMIKEIIRDRPDSSVIIIADKFSETGRVIEVMDECKSAGAQNLSLAAMKEE